MDEYEAMLQAQRELAATRMGGFETTADRNSHIAQQYLSGLNSRQIADQLRVSRQRVWQILKRAGVQSHAKRLPGAEALVALVRDGRYGSIPELAKATGHSPSRLRTRLNKHPEWPEVRQQMRQFRQDSSKSILRERMINTYRALAAELGRPASIAEMTARGIFTAALYRVYGTNYITKFREEVGEVS